MRVDVLVRYSAQLMLLFLVAACSAKDVDAPLANTAGVEALDIYKSPTCQCCQHWVDHMESAGFSTTTFHPDDLNGIKNTYGIEPTFQSCHTAVTADGYVFEGHIPARYVVAFLKNPPAGAKGLAVPGMPLGSPGMEMGDRFTPYDVLQLNQDGSVNVFARVDSPSQQ